MMNKSNEIQNYYILSLRGELDASSSIEADKEFESATDLAQRFLLIDCHGLQYISSTGIGVILYYYQLLQKRQVHLVVYGLKPQIYNVFEVLGLHELLTIVSSQAAALAFCNEENINRNKQKNC